MKRVRPIIHIDEELCNGCGQCVIACAEGALELKDGKARLVGEIYCDGLAACIGECPTGALSIVEREAEDFDEVAVERLLHQKKHAESREKGHSLPCGCPGSMAQVIEPGSSRQDIGHEGRISSELRQWPVKLQLLGPRAPFLQGSDLLLLADCVAVAFPELHREILPGHALAIGCPKLDDLEAHIQRLSEILTGAKPRSLTVVHMEVPCCRGFVYAAEQAIKRSGVDVPLRRIQIGINGEIQEEQDLSPACGCAASISG